MWIVGMLLLVSGEDCMASSSLSVEAHMRSEVITEKMGTWFLVRIQRLLERRQLQLALKSLMKVPGSKSGMQSVTWADENGSVLEASKLYESPSSNIKQSEEDMDISLRRASAEACAAALIEAAEAISSGTSEVDDVGEHIFTILIPKHCYII
jgi:hypothetical protein